MRRILAFFLFLSISFLSLMLCVRTSFVSKSAIINTFTSDTYVSGVYKSVYDYAHDLCDECAIPYDSIDETVSYNSVYRIQKAYYNGILSASEDYTDTTYTDYIATLGKDLEDSTLSMLKKYNISTAGNTEKDVKQFSKKITDYLTGVTRLKFTDRLSSVLSFAQTASLIAAAAVFLLALVLALFVVSIGTKLYRALRDIAVSFFAAGLMNILLVVGVEAVKHFKRLLLYPLYFSQALTEYVDKCIFSVGVSSAVLFFTGLIVAAVVWRLNRNENN